MPGLSSQPRAAISLPSRLFNAAQPQSPKRAAAAGRLQFIEREGQHIGGWRWGGEGGCSLQHLYAVILAIAHDDAALAVDQNAVGTVELPISTALAADGSHVAAVTVA
jgi:hypothetical protein